jgi:hypothetical protein
MEGAKTMLTKIDATLQKDLIDFIKKRESEKNQPFGKVLVATILRKLIDGDCRITGCAKNDKTGKLWVEYSFYEEERGNE